MNDTERFRKGLEEGYKEYLSVHPRSRAKILPIHQVIAEILLAKLGGQAKGFTVLAMGIDNSKELALGGKYYTKAIDIAVLYNNQPVSGLGFKFITSNYKQNSNNYFENMLGETANLKRVDFLYGQMLVFKHKMPYYSSDQKTFTKIEHINETNIVKYLKLYNDKAQALYHKPDIIYVSFIETGDEKAFGEIAESYQRGQPIQIDKGQFHRAQIARVKVNFVKPAALREDGFSSDTIRFLDKVGNFETFMDAFVHLTLGKTYSM